MNGDNLLTLKQAASKLNCSYSYLYRSYRQGLIKVVKRGRFVRISEHDLYLWIHANEIAANIIAATSERREARDERERAAGFIPRADLANGQA